MSARSLSRPVGGISILSRPPATELWRLADPTSTKGTIASSLTLSAEVELLEAEAWATLHGAFAHVGGEQIAAVKRWGRPAALVTRNVEAVAINRAIGFGFDHSLDPQEFAEVRTFFRDSGKSRWFFECSPDASIDSTALVAAGGVIGGSIIKLVGKLDALSEPSAPSLEIVEVTARDTATFMAIVGPQLGVPELVRPGIVSTMGHSGWRFYLALDDNRPIAGAAMFLGGDGAWLGLAGTLPEYRQRGAQTALLWRRMHDARSAGCRWVSAETSPETLSSNPSLRNLKRIGMRELYHRPWYRFHEGRSRPSA
jgi:hypothetical protein